MATNRLLAASFSMTLVLAFVVDAVAAPTRAGAYVDTKQRFRVVVPHGFKLAPLPGDVGGMVWRKDYDGVPALVRVSVRTLRMGETIDMTLDDAETLFRGEIGFAQISAGPAAFGGQLGKMRVVKATASGDSSTERHIEIYAIHHAGSAHVLHAETRIDHQRELSLDVARFLMNYTPERVAGAQPAALAGLWRSTDGRPDLRLDAIGTFGLGPLSGSWRFDGGRLTLRIASGEETYQVILKDSHMSLVSPNLSTTMEYRRDKAATGAATPVVLTRERLIGTWKLVDAQPGEPLVLRLAESGAVSFGGLSGRWTFSTGRLTITSTAGKTVTYHAALVADQLIMGGGDLDRDVLLTREVPPVPIKSGKGAP